MIAAEATSHGVQDGCHMLITGSTKPAVLLDHSHDLQRSVFIQDMIKILHQHPRIISSLFFVQSLTLEPHPRLLMLACLGNRPLNELQRLQFPRRGLLGSRNGGAYGSVESFGSDVE